MNIPSSILVLCFKELILAVILGALIGLEREWARKEAGLRTFTLISLGSALFVMISRLAFYPYLSISSLDPSRTLGQLIIGIGFLGAGTIIFSRSEEKVKGLTTAAMIWVTAAIGAAIGLQLYWLAIFTTLLVVILSFSIIPFEHHLEQRIKKIKGEKKEE